MIQGVKVEHATVQRTLTPWATTARPTRVDGNPGWESGIRADNGPAVADRAWSISEPERPRRRHVDPQLYVSPDAADFPLVGARGAGRAKRGGDTSDGAAGSRTRTRRSSSGAGPSRKWRQASTPLGVGLSQVRAARSLGVGSEAMRGSVGARPEGFQDEGLVLRAVSNARGLLERCGGSSGLSAPGTFQGLSALSEGLPRDFSPPKTASG